MVNTQLKILRVFGPTAAEVSAVLRQARDDGCPGLRLLERDGEFAVCVQVSAPNRAMAEQYCEKWTQRLAAKFGDDVFATGETGLAQATLNALLQKRKLLVAADETTGRLVGALLRPLPHSEAVFDFGTESYADPQKSQQITVPPQLLKKFPGDVVQAAAGRAASALQVTGADLGVAYMAATVGQCPFVLVCDRHGAAACALPPELSDAAIGNQILDLVRRRLLGLRLTDSCITFKVGRDRPLLIVSEAGRDRGTTVRFSLRRRTPPTDEPDNTADFEPMLDFNTAAPEADDEPQPAPAAPRRLHTQPRAAEPAPAVDPAPTGAIRFEDEADDTNAPNTPETANAGQAPAARRGTAIRRAPQPSILDEDVPDFSAGLDPQQLAAAQAADEAAAAAGRAPDEADFARAANRLFEDDDTDADDEAPQPAPRRRTRREADTAQSLRDRSLAMIEKTERRRRRTVVTILIVIALLVLAGVAAVWLFFRSDLGARPAAKSYGTTLYDDTASAYLQKALTRRPGAVGYLGWPGLDGELVYAAGTEPTQTDENAAAAITRFATANALDADAAGNTVLECTGTTYACLADEETVKDNGGFTLYLAGGTYRFKLLAVYYYDPTEEGDGAFDLYGSTDLSQYYDYLSFVAGIQARSLWDTNVETGDNAHFLTLTTKTDQDGVLLCATGRMIEADEGAWLDTASFTANDDALLTAAQYRAKGQAMPSVSSLLSAGVERYASQSAAQAENSDAEQNAGQSADSAAAGSGSELSEAVSALQQQTQALITDTTTLLKGLTDVAGGGSAAEADLNKGAEGTLPEQNVSVEQVAATPAPTEAASSAEGESTSQSTAAGESTSTTTDASGDTINVTMNGTAQTMDLVTCLAMVAQNELGSNAPLEAYKAQCVATHCWIISQSGYPSVLGTTPGATALAAAQSVAHVLVTYNGKVCFTPYFASASTGTASAADVWGNERAWLQAVDSPYDQSVSSHWHTNGSESGTARFARSTLISRIKDKLGIDLTNVDPNQWFHILSTNAYGWVAKIQVGPDGSCETVSGRWFRENLLAGQSVDGRSLRSQCFTVTYDSSLDCFIFDVYGYGHGCGMSQWGAIGYANNGWGYQQILTHYYTGTTITTY